MALPREGLTLHNPRKPGSRYFEGWYFKHQNSETAVALIPGMSVDDEGAAHAFVQVVTDAGAHYAAFDTAHYRACHHTAEVTIGKNRFSPRGVQLALEKPGLSVRGSLRYGPLTPAKGDIMGFFSMLPRMECRHGLVSLLHTVEGRLQINGQEYRFDGGMGYLERDWGCSFPESYTWAQCSSGEQGGWSAFASQARIPYMGLCFTGCIAVLYCEGKEHRFATYNGARVLAADPHSIRLVRGRQRLELAARPAASQRLLAPSKGRMGRVVHEAVCCPVRVRFWEGERLLFEGCSNQGGFETSP